MLIALRYYLIVISVIVYVLRQNCRAAGWRRDSIRNENWTEKREQNVINDKSDVNSELKLGICFKRAAQ
jgi:hypothetical protein